VADLIVDVIDRPRADVYSRPGLRDQVLAYFGAEDMGAYEAAMPNLPAPSPAAPPAR
jgi:hypothetical protein